MEAGPIFRALARNKLGVILIAVQIAFTMTVIVNAVYIINGRGELMARPSGVDEPNLFYLTSIGFVDRFNEEVVVREDLSRLRQTPGIADATIINAIPVSGGGSSSGYTTQRGRRETIVPAAYYEVDERGLSTLGLQLVAGRNFNAADVLVRRNGEAGTPDNVIITRALAEKFFPDETDVIGRHIYDSLERALRIIGVVERLQTPWPSVDFVEQSMLVPEHFIDGTTTYLVRAEPGQRDRMMVEVEEMLTASSDQRIIRGLDSVEAARAQSYRIDAAMSRILTVIIVALTFITAMGIAGLAVFSINRRRRQVGTRRALGATKGEIMRYFLLENMMITSVGVLVGAVATIGFNIFLVQTFNMPRIEWYYTPLGMLALILVGQLAVVGPSRGATLIPPALATRSV